MSKTIPTIFSMKINNVTKASLEERARKYQESLEEVHGPVMTGTALRKLLGYKTAAAFRQAYKRDKLPIPVLTQHNRRGYFARTTDVATWLAEFDEMAENVKNIKKSKA